MRAAHKSIAYILFATCGLSLAATPAPAQSGDSKARHHVVRTATPKAASQEAQHKDCLAFIERHGLSCDPWKQPTCGYDLGIARPLTCVAP
jgi:hypothetical protein